MRSVGFVIDGRAHCVNCIDAPTLTASGLAIKAAAGVDGQYQLMAESRDPLGDDAAIGDAQAVILSADGTSKFYAVPPTCAA